MNASVLKSSFVVFLALGFLAACAEEAPEVVERIRAIKTVTVSERASGQVRRFPGVVEAVDTSSLSFEVGGNVQKVNVDIGAKIARGDVLAELDKQPFELNMQAAEAELGRAQAELAEKQNDFDRQKTLYSKDWVSKAALDQAAAAFDSARNNVSFARSKLNLARRDLEKTALVAPFDGVVATRSVDPFQEIQRGESLFEIFAEGAMEVAINVPETSIGNISLGLAAEIRFPTESERSYQGAVSEIGSAAGTANAFPVKVAVLDDQGSIRPGMTAEITVLLGGGDAEVSYLVPVTAIVPGGEPGDASVFVFDTGNSTVARTKVEIEGVHDDQVVVTSGLAAGDIVAIAGVSFLDDGQQVKLLEPSAAALATSLTQE